MPTRHKDKVHAHTHGQYRRGRPATGRVTGKAGRDAAAYSRSQRKRRRR